mmetsp:Transcript_33989/g.97770  ORF Transcript_33989/g.97770 Transcript_33989/m.97770 type:complete len:229 (-) Transcript_33989:176-862(-)
MAPMPAPAPACPRPPSAQQQPRPELRAAAPGREALQRVVGVTVGLKHVIVELVVLLRCVRRELGCIIHEDLPSAYCVALVANAGHELGLPSAFPQLPHQWRLNTSRQTHNRSVLAACVLRVGTVAPLAKFPELRCKPAKGLFWHSHCYHLSVPQGAIVGNSLKVVVADQASGADVRAAGIGSSGRDVAVLSAEVRDLAHDEAVLHMPEAAASEVDLDLRALGWWARRR